MATTKLIIKGMSCMHCVNHVKEALEELDGVQNVIVNLEEGNAVIEHDDNVSVEDMKNIVIEVRI